MKIYKYGLPRQRGDFKRAMSEIQYTMHVEVVNDNAYLWACCDPTKELTYTIRVLFTGDDVPDMDNFLKIGTAVFDDGRYVLHYYREVSN